MASYRKIFRTIVCISFFLLNGNLAGARPRVSELEYYKLEFIKPARHILADTLFEKTVWHKKVSHIVLEEKKDRFYVTLLMISPYPHNYKSENYALHYEFYSYQEAFQKFVWLDKFLRKNGVLRIKILGSKITSEKILYNGEP